MKKMILIFVMLFCANCITLAQTQPDTVEVNRITSEQAIEIARQALVDQGGNTANLYKDVSSVKYLEEEKVWSIYFVPSVNKDGVAPAVGGVVVKISPVWKVTSIY